MAMGTFMGQRWRLRVGTGLFALGLFCPLLVPLVSAVSLSTRWRAGLSGMLLLGIPEVLWVAAAAVMGKEGFDFLKGRIWSGLKHYLFPQTVGPIRYGIGLVLFLIPVIFGWLSPYAAHMIPGYSEHRLALALLGDSIFLASLLVLGGDFWDKLRALFSPRARAEFPEP